MVDNDKANNTYTDIISDGGMDPRNQYEQKNQEAVTVDKFDVMDVNEKQREHIDFLNARIKALRTQTLYVVEMLRGGSRERHSYIASIFDNEHEARKCGEIEKSWRACKYEYEIIKITLNDFDDESGEKHDHHEQCRPRSFTYSTNWMGPISTKWYSDRGLTRKVTKVIEQGDKFYPKGLNVGSVWEYEEVTENYSCGRIDIRGDTESPYGDEYGVAPMRTEDWNAFGEWLEYLDTTYLWTYQELLEGFENDTGIEIRWAEYPI